MEITPTPVPDLSQVVTRLDGLISGQHLQVILLSVMFGGMIACLILLIIYKFLSRT